jgi:hypothetical protein
VFLDVCAAFPYVWLILLVEMYVEEVSIVVVYPSGIGVSDVEVTMWVIDQCLSVEFV